MHDTERQCGCVPQLIRELRKITGADLVHWFDLCRPPLGTWGCYSVHPAMHWRSCIEKGGQLERLQVWPQLMLLAPPSQAMADEYWEQGHHATLVLVNLVPHAHVSKRGKDASPGRRRLPSMYDG